MKKSSITMGIAVALAVAYPAASWLTGKQLETKLSQVSGQDPVLPNFKIIQRNYTRGVFSSIQEGTIELTMPDMGSKITPASLQESTQNETNENAPGLKPPGKPVQIQIINRIQHGPVPAIFGLAAAKIDTEFVLDAASIAEIKKLFGDKKFVEIRTLLNYTGGGSVNLSSPAINTVVGANQDKLDWKGIRLEVGFDAIYKKLKFDLLSPGLEILAANGGTSVKVGEIKMKGDAERAYPESFIYIGKSTASIGDVAYSNAQAPNTAFSLKNLNVESVTNSKNDLLDFITKFGIENVIINKADFGNFHYDFSMLHMHGPTINKLYKDVYSSNFSKPSSGSEENAKKYLDNWKQYGSELLRHEPVLSLDKLSLTSKGGEFKSSAKVKFANVTDGDMADPKQLISKLEGVMDIAVAEGLVQELIEKTQSKPDVRGMMMGAFSTQVGAYETQGYIKRNAKDLSAQIAWKAGKLMINGKAFPPAGPAEAAVPAQ